MSQGEDLVEASQLPEHGDETSEGKKGRERYGIKQGSVVILNRIWAAPSRSNIKREMG